MTNEATVAITSRPPVQPVSWRGNQDVSTCWSHFALVRRLGCRVISRLLCGLLLVACAGCQTFNLSEEDFQKQQRGGMVDPATGEAVGVAGSLGFLGAMIGAAVAGAGK
jgi:hypothetical protein